MNISNNISHFFINFQKFLSSIPAISNELDISSELLKTTYEKLIAFGSLILLVPVEQGGLNGGRKEWIEHNISLAQYSGAVLFLQAQHQFAIFQLKRFLPNPVVEVILKQVVQEDLALGISFVATRKLVVATQNESIFQLSGVLPWVTGYNFFSKILISFDCEDKVYYCLIPFQEIINDKQEILISPVIKTAVFSSANTVKVTLENWFIAKEDILFCEPIASLPPHVYHPAIYNFCGVAKQLLNMAQQGKYFVSDRNNKLYDKLLAQVEDYYKKIFEKEVCPLKLRAQGLMLAEQCLLLARISLGACSILEDHPINRIAREIWQYTVAGYSQPQADNYITELNSFN